VEKMTSLKMEDLVESTHRRVKARDPINVLSLVYTPERVTRMENALRAAEGTEGLSEKQLRRLQLVRVEWDYAKNVGTIARNYRDYELKPSPEIFDALLDGLRERNSMIERLFPEGKSVRKLTYWPELPLFGNPPLDQFKTNGRLGATLTAPLLWDADAMKRYGIRPPHRMSPADRAAEIVRTGAKPITGFRLHGPLQPGASFEPNADGSAFRFGCGTNTHVRVMRRLGAKEGVLPNRVYRITWLTRWEHVLSPVSYRGYYIGVGNRKGADRVVHPGDANSHRGDSDGWVRECVLLRTTDEPKYATDLTFGFWYGMTGVAEVENVTVEDVTDL